MTSKVYNSIYSGLYYFDTFTFTTLGTSGYRGPDVTKGYANAPWRDGDFYIQDGQQYWTVPASGTYQITAAGAYGATPGRVVSGQVNLNEGQTLQMLVGQQPTSTYAGGGTWIATDKLLMVASGGDGTGGHTASFSPYGSGEGSNGAGYLTDGLQTNPDFAFIVPNAYIHGGFGNRNIYNSTEAGFGGANLVGAGGYTGSPGDGVSGATCYADESVQNFMDLGASGNTAGTVTVSLIDPVPLKQTWTWENNQSITNTINFPHRSIQWSPELNLFLSTESNSPDGVTWNGSFVTKQLTVVNIAYSPVLKRYAGVIYSDGYGSSGYIGYSSDAVSWTYSISDIDPLGATVYFSPELNVFISSADYTRRSTDGINWSIVYGSGLNLAYSPSLHTFVGFTSDNIVYSTDGTNWYNATFDPISNPNIFRSVTWSSKLGLFIISKNDVPIRSTDGITWTSTGVVFPTTTNTNGWLVAWSSDFGIFSLIGGGYTLSSTNGVTWIIRTNVASLANATYSAVSYSPSLKRYVAIINDTSQLISIDGIYWIPTNYSLEYYDGAWSPQLGLFVNTNASYSVDGLVWETLYPNFSFVMNTVVWSPELGLFSAWRNRGLSADSSMYISRDGKSWTRVSGIVYNPSFVWSAEVGMFVGLFYSRDGITWTDNTSAFGISLIQIAMFGWSPDLRLFTAVLKNSTNSYAFYSSDGINWTSASSFRTLFIGDSGEIAWSPSLSMFLIGRVSLPRSSTSGVVYSRDGKDWSFMEILQESPSPGIPSVIWVPELSIFVAPSFDGFGCVISSDGFTWTPVLLNTFIGNIWSRELGRFICFCGVSDVTKTF
jgi:hypothetical protein